MAVPTLHNCQDHLYNHCGGGSVVTYVRYGDKVYSPVIAAGEADFIVSFEKIEAARYAQNLKEGGRIIVNSQMIDPMPVITGAAEYPAGILEELKAKGVLVDEIDALSLAQQAGNAKSVNIVLMGRLNIYYIVDNESRNAKCNDYTFKNNTNES